MTISVKTHRKGETEERFIYNKGKGHKMSKFDNWTDEEINILNIYYEKESRINIENMLKNRAWQAIQIKANRLGLHRMNYF